MKTSECILYYNSLSEDQKQQPIDVIESILVATMVNDYNPETLKPYIS
jgi:hypothetical protein